MKIKALWNFCFISPRGCRLAEGCLSLFSLLALSAFVTLLMTWWGDLHPLPFSRSETEISAPSGHFSAIPAAHLFGQHPAISIDAIPLSAAPLQLTGVIEVNDKTAFSKAIIAESGGTGKIYQEGDILPEGIKLIRVQGSQVILEREGHLERLPLQRLSREAENEH